MNNFIQNTMKSEYYSENYNLLIELLEKSESLRESMEKYTSTVSFFSQSKLKPTNLLNREILATQAKRVP